MDVSTSKDGYVDKRPPPKNLHHHISRVTKALGESPLMGIFSHFGTPGVAQLAGDFPSPEYYLFDTLEAQIATPDRWRPTPNEPTQQQSDGTGPEAPPSSTSSKQKTRDRVTVPHKSGQSNGRRRVDVASGLAPGTVQGLPPFYWIFQGFVQKHMQPNCPYYDGPEFLLTCGRQDGWAKVLQALTGEWHTGMATRERDALLVEKFCHTQALQGVRPRGVHVVPVEIDGEGMLADGPGGLREILENWDYETSRRPRLIYQSTMGHNPTSGILSLRRRREIYALACEFDLIICEDDPYWFLQYPSAAAGASSCSTTPAGDGCFLNGEAWPAGWKTHGYAFFDSLVPSSVEIDPDGRVIRLEDFSHVAAPGCRIGWIAAQGRPFIERIARITETCTSQPSGLAQALMAEFLLGVDPVDGGGEGGGGAARLPVGGWRADGWVRWLEGLRGEYERRMNTMSRVLEAGSYHVVDVAAGDTAAADVGWRAVDRTRMMSFERPRAGMFLWLRVLFENHPLFPAYRHEPHQLSTALWRLWLTEPYLVVTYPGTTFCANEDIAKAEGWRYFRLSFGAVAADELAACSQRLVDGVAAFWSIRDKKTIERLLEEGEASGAGKGKPGLVDLGQPGALFQGAR